MLMWCLYLSALALTALWAALGGVTALPQLWRLIPAYVIALLVTHLVYVLGLCLIRLLFRDRVIEKQSNLARACCAGVGDLFCFYAGVRAHISGLEKLPQDQKYLFVCNHKSMFDPLVVMGAMKKQNISFISKPSNLKIPVAGVIAKNAGFLAIDRENNREALKTILQAAEYLKNGVCNMGIYPEGTRSKTSEMLPFHAGSFKIAQKAGVPVVCTAVRNTENVQHNFPFRKTNVYIDILEVIDADFVKNHSTRETAELAQSIIQAKLDTEAAKEESGHGK